MRCCSRRVRSSASPPGRSPRSRTRSRSPSSGPSSSSRAKDRNLGELAEALDVHPSSATRLCTRLESKGLITRAPAAGQPARARGQPDAGRAHDRRHRHEAAPARDRPDHLPHPGPASGRCSSTRSGSSPRPPARCPSRRGPSGGSIGEQLARTRWASREAHGRRRVRASGPGRCSLFAALAGALTGFGVALFETVVVELLFDELLDLPLWALAFMPAIGLVDRRGSRCATLGPATPATDRRVPPGVPRSRRQRLTLRDASRPGCSPRSARWASAAQWGSKDRRSTSGASIGAGDPGPLPALLPLDRPPGADGRGRRRRRRRDLQGPGDRRGLRARGSVPGRLRPQDAAARARRRGQRLPRRSSRSTAPRR